MAKKDNGAVETALVEKQVSSLALPDYITGTEGTEMIERSDVTYPRLGLCQALTPQKKKSDPNYITGLEEGLFFNTITQEIYGTEVFLIPVLFSKQRIKFHPMNEGGGIECQSFNGKDGGFLAPVCESPDGTAICEHAKFSENKRPTCDKLHNRPCVVVVPSDEKTPTGIFACRLKGDGPLVVSLKSTGLKISKQWNSLVKLTPAPMFARVYSLLSNEVRKGDQTWFAPVVKPRGFVPPDMFKAMKQMYDGLKGINIMADTTGMETEDAPETGDTSF